MRLTDYSTNPLMRENFGSVVKPGSLDGQQRNVAVPNLIFAHVETTRGAGPAIDYYALLAGAVCGLIGNTTAMRRALYASAETALIRELRNHNPPLPEAEILREHLSFHRAIQRVETEWMFRDTVPLSRAKLGRDTPPSDLPASVSEMVAVKRGTKMDESGASEPAVDSFETGSDPPPPSWLLAKVVEPRERPARSIKGVIWASVLMFIVGILAVTVFLRPERMMNPPVLAHLAQALGDTSSLPKILEFADWVSSWALETKRSLMAPVAQSAVLYVEDPTDLRAIRYIGSVMWRSETPEDGSPLGLVSLASINIPELNMNISIRFRRNVDKALAATHIIEMMFNSADPAFGGISDVLGIMLKQSEDALGQRLAGVIKHRTSVLFIVALSTTETDTRYNRELMKEQFWFDISIVYTSGRRAILAFEKDKEAFAKWSDQ